MIIHLLSVLAASELSRQIAHDSELAYQIKKFLLLDNSKNRLLSALRNINFYFSIFPIFISILLIPLSLVIYTSVKIHQLINEIINCQFCLGFWLGSLTYYFLLSTQSYSSASAESSIPLAILSGLLTTLTVKLLERYA